MHLSNVHLKTALYEEGIHEAKEALEIFEQLGNTVGQAQCSMGLAWLFHHDKQLDAAEEAASRAISLLSGKDRQFDVCQCHRALGVIYGSKGEVEKAIHHFETALEIASSPNWLHELFWTQFSLALLFYNQSKLEDAHAHVEQAKSHAVEYRDTYLLARAMTLQAELWHKQHRFEEAKSEASRAVYAFEKLGAMQDLGRAGLLLLQIFCDTDGGEPLETATFAYVY